MKQNNQKCKRWIVALLLALPLSLFAQNITLTGSVKDMTGEPIVGANVIVVNNPALGTITNVEGIFTLSVPQTTAEVEVSFLGMLPQRIAVVAGRPLNVVLREDTEQLEEVVVIGYQTVRRRDLTGSVASVQGSSIAAMPVSNVAQSLQGKLPGVNVIAQDGRPDATISIRVRGGGSISQSNDPLVLIDGISGSISDVPADQVESIDVLKDASSTAIYGARGANGVILITTKGAKEGKVSVTYNGYAKWNTPTKYLDALDPYDYLAYKWAIADAYDPTGAYRTPLEHLYGLGAGGPGIEAYRNTPEYDIQREIYNSSFSHNHDVTINGGSETTRAMFSVNYMDEQGMKLNSYRKRANVSLKVNHQIRRNLSVAVDARYTDIDNMGNEGTTSGAGSTLSSAYRFRPIATGDIKGDLGALREGYIDSYGRWSQWDAYNQYNIIRDRENLSLNQALRATLSLNWELIKGLTYHTDLTLSRGWGETKNWRGPTPATDNELSYLADDDAGTLLAAGNADYQKSANWGLRWTNTLNYELTLADVHRINVLAGHEVTGSGGSSLRMNATRFPSNYTKETAFGQMSQYDAANGGTMTLYSPVNIPNRMLSLFGRINYSLMDRYLATVTFRADGSSKFPGSHRWGYFPAAALAWRVSEEAFMKEVDWLDNLKLRLSYGEVGNDGISSGMWTQLWTAEGDNRWQYALNNTWTPAYDLASAQMANDELKWETTVTRNIGLDFGLLNGRLWGTLDLYHNTTRDLLMLTQLPAITGFTSAFKNLGQTSNKGVELSLSGVIYKDRDWNVTAGFNINFNRGNVDELADGVTGQYGTQWIQQNRPADDYILIEGRPVGLVRGLVSEGFYTPDDFDYANGMYTLKQGVADVSTYIIPEFYGPDANGRPGTQNAYPGMAKFKDLNDDGVIDTDDYDIIGDMNPVHTGGFNLNASYKGFDLGLYFNWSYGNEVYNVTRLASFYGYSRGGVFENKLAFMKDAYKLYDIQGGQLVRVTTPDELKALNVNAKYPLAYNAMGIVSDLGIEDGSYLRLNTLTLGYTLPKTLLAKAGISNLRLYGTVYNLLTLTGYSGLDPEVNANSNVNNATYPTTGLDWGAYPRSRSFVLGMNLTF